MQFSDTSNLDGIIEDITFQTGGVHTSEYTVKDRTRRVNQWYKRTIVTILKALRELGFRDTTLGVTVDNSWTPATDGTLVRDVTSGTRGYQLPTTNKLWVIWRVAYMRDGVNYFDAQPFHIGQVGGVMNDTTLDSETDQTTPVYRIDGDRIFLYPQPNASVTSGLKIWAVREPAQFASTDTTKKSELDSIFDDILSLGASYDYLRSKDKANAERVKRDLNELRAEIVSWYADKLDDADVIARPDPGNYD